MDKEKILLSYLHRIRAAEMPFALYFLPLCSSTSRTERTKL